MLASFVRLMERSSTACEWLELLNAALHPECSKRSFDVRRRKQLLWVLYRSSEVGKMSCCTLSWVEASGDLLEVW